MIPPVKAIRGNSTLGKFKQGLYEGKYGIDATAKTPADKAGTLVKKSTITKPTIKMKKTKGEEPKNTGSTLKRVVKTESTPKKGVSKKKWGALTKDAGGKGKLIPTAKIRKAAGTTTGRPKTGELKFK